MNHIHAKGAVAGVVAALLAGCGGGGGGSPTYDPPSQPTNAAPQIASVGKQSGDENSTIGPITFTVSDAETAAESLKVTVTAANGTLLPANGVDLEATGGTRSLLLTPAVDQSGTTQVTLTVTDAAGATTSTQFELAVNPLLRAEFSDWMRATVYVRDAIANPVGEPAEEGQALAPVEDINRISFRDSTANDPTAYADLIPPPPPPEPEE